MRVERCEEKGEKEEETNGKTNNTRQNKKENLGFSSILSTPTKPKPKPSHPKGHLEVSTPRMLRAAGKDERNKGENK